MAPFQFRKFAIDDSQCAMKIGTDGVLLGAWAFNEYLPKSILDIGAGSGLLSLMMAQRFPQASITGIEIVPAGAEVAERNVKQSPWADRVKILNIDALLFTPSRPIDAIISNPPFYDEAIKSDNIERKLARHGEDLNIHSLIVKSSSILLPGGHMALIAPTRRADEIIYDLTINRLDPERVTFVSSKENSEPNRVMIEAVKGTAKRYQLETLCIHNLKGSYSPEYQVLTGAFYLETTFK